MGRASILLACFPHATILPGADSGEGAVVAVGSVVTEPVDVWKVVAGAPARVVGNTRETDEPYLAGPLLARWHAEWQQDGPGRPVSP